MIARVLSVLLCLVAAPAAAASSAPAATVEVVRDGDRWTADYQLHARAPVWAFAKSILPRETPRSWRLDSVRVLTPGVTLQRLGHHDALVARRGVLPPRVRLEFTPYTLDIEAGYDAAIGFSDGSVALYADGFKLVPMASAAATRAAGKDESALPTIARPTRTIFVDRAGPVLARGTRQARAQMDHGEAYVLFGTARPSIGAAMTTIFDPALPPWISAYFNREMPRILADYRARLGPSPVGQPTLMVAWAGATPGKVSLGGSVLPGLVVMTLEGQGLATRNDKAAHHARWFVAHEAAHFWLGQAVAYDGPADSWITEGGADLLAFRATAAGDPTFDVTARLAEARAECLPFLARGGIAGAYLREGDHRAYYACGAIIALAAEQASGGDFGAFVRTLIARNPDGIVTRDEWLALLEQRAPGRGLAAAIANLLDRRQPDPAAALDAFIARAGIGHAIAVKAATPAR
ncbi:hypothetical protein [Sphingomonas sp.]|uniref:hypothetical protein n=1 Tax=Sphingomonas sp. TaxID=28214 RepID=UPI00286D7D4D|nr:hypothetical protein [Sphingomonas sp.]